MRNHGRVCRTRTGAFMTLNELVHAIKSRLLGPVAYHRALRAVRKFKPRAWYLCDLLEHGLRHGLVSPAEVMRALQSWREHAEEYARPVPTFHTLADVATVTE